MATDLLLVGLSGMALKSICHPSGMKEGFQILLMCVGSGWITSKMHTGEETGLIGHLHWTWVRDVLQEMISPVKEKFLRGDRYLPQHLYCLIVV